MPRALLVVCAAAFGLVIGLATAALVQPAKRELAGQLADVKAERDKLKAEVDRLEALQELAAQLRKQPIPLLFPAEELVENETAGTGLGVTRAEMERFYSRYLEADFEKMETEGSTICRADGIIVILQGIDSDIERVYMTYPWYLDDKNLAARSGPIYADAENSRAWLAIVGLFQHLDHLPAEDLDQLDMPNHAHMIARCMLQFDAKKGFKNCDDEVIHRGRRVSVGLTGFVNDGEHGRGVFVLLTVEPANPLTP